MRPLTGKETEAQRSEALSFPGPFGLLIFPGPTHSTMDAVPTAGGSLRLFTLGMKAVSQTREFQNVVL